MATLSNGMVCYINMRIRLSIPLSMPHLTTALIHIHVLVIHFTIELQSFLADISKYLRILCNSWLLLLVCEVQCNQFSVRNASLFRQLYLLIFIIIFLFSRCLILFLLFSFFSYFFFLCSHIL